MNGELLAAVGLASHGSWWLRHDDSAPAPELELTSPLFQFVRSVTFAPPAIVGVGSWLTSLRERHADRLWLVVHEDPSAALPPHLAAAFAGGGAWLLLATGPGVAEAWTSMWDVGDPEAPDSRIWDVNYRGTTLDPHDVGAPGTSFDEGRAGLVAALTAILDFARAQRLDHWSELFERALATDDEVTDVLPAAYPRAAHQLLAMASASWVFGGMGSWNDMGFATREEHEDYEAVSRLLHAAVMNAVTAAVNAPLD